MGVIPKKIVVIDDEPLVLTTVEKALGKVGYSVSCVPNVRELELALINAPFDLLITDLHMDDATADEIIEMVRASSPGVKIIIMSGSSSAARTANFIEKPFRLDELRDKVRACLDEPS